MRNVTEIQQRLIDMGFLAPRGEKGERSDDGRFGERSMAAYNRFLASKGKPPHQGMILLAELNANLFPEEQPAPKPPKSNPLQNWLIDLAIKKVASNLKGSNMSFLLGTKTAITGIVMIIIGAASLLAPVIGLGAIPGLDALSPGEAMNSIGVGFGLIFLRGGIAKVGN